MRRDFFLFLRGGPDFILAGIRKYHVLCGLRGGPEESAFTLVIWLGALQVPGGRVGGGGQPQSNSILVEMACPLCRMDVCHLLVTLVTTSSSFVWPTRH